MAEAAYNLSKEKESIWSNKNLKQSKETIHLVIHL